MKPLKKNVSITLDEDIVTLIKTIAKRDDRSLSQYINLVLKEFLENYKNEKFEKFKGK